jgi:5-oxoprolinase (ATP-hydrolysing)
MTNTRLTDPEVIEQKYPIRVVEFRIRENSGGAGRHRGGNGVVRCLEFTAPLQVSILSQRRAPHAPYGLCGGEAGEPGRNTLFRADGSSDELLWRALIEVEAGDRLVIATPGGGGYGAPDVQPK